MKEAFTPVSRLFLDRQGILKITIADGAVLLLEDVKNVFEVEKRMLEGNKGLVLIDATTGYTLSPDARNFAIAQRETRQATGIITTSITYKLLNDIYSSFYSSTSPMKVFLSEEKAREWLLAFSEVRKAV